MQTLTVTEIITNAVEIGMKNLASLVGAVALWLLTFWIPYLNVGTTIGLVMIVLEMSRGNVISPTAIFDPRYRQYMGEFFLLLAFLMFGTMAGYLFFIIPGIVISIAWGQAVYIMFDKGKNPTECLTLSNQITYGKKWVIFGASFLLGVALYIVLLVVGWILSHIWDFLAGLFYLVWMVAAVAISMGAQAYIYRVLSMDLEMETPAAPEPL